MVDVALDSNGNVWAGIYVDYLISVGGLAVWNGTSWTDYDYVEGANGLVGHVVRDLAIDSQNNVWVATSTGVTKISGVELFVPDLSDGANIEVYPNPTSSNLMVSTELQIHDFRLINTAGCEVTCPTTHTHNTIQLDVSSLVKGFYILDLKTEYENLRKPLLIE